MISHFITPRKLLVWSPDDDFRPVLGQALSATGVSYQHLPRHFGASVQGLFGPGTEHVLLVDCCAGIHEALQVTKVMPQAPVIFVFGGARGEMIRDLFDKTPACHVLGRNHHVLRHEMLPVANLCGATGDIWKSMQEGATRVCSERFWDGSNIKEAVEHTRAVADSLPAYPEFANYVATSVWELLTNAIYDARRGTPIELSRDFHEALPDSLRTPDRLVTLEICHDAQKIAVRIADNLGRLKREMVLKNWLRADARTSGQIKNDRGGAGVGLYMVLNESAQLIFNIRDGISTEVIFSLPLERMNRSFLTRIPSVHFFEIGG